MNSGSMIERFAIGTGKAVSLLYENGLYGQMLIIIYSAIDTMGLLDAPPEQTDATGASFQSWVAAYMALDSRIEFTPLDLWAARCSVIHTFTSTSKISKRGDARELQYYGGSKDSAEARHFETYTRTLHGGRHVPVHLGDLCAVFIAGVAKFALVLASKCNADPAYTQRLRNVLQVHPLQSVA